MRPKSDECPTVAAICDAYLKGYSSPRGNLTTDEANLRAPLGAFGAMTALELIEQDMEIYATRRMAGKYGRAVKAATVRRDIASLQAAMNWASKRGFIPGRPTFNLWRPSDDGKPRDLWLNEEQEARVLAALPAAPEHVRIFTRLALTYGARLGAIMGLRIGPQIDFRGATIDFNEPGKRTTRKRRPRVPMTETIRRDLQVACLGKPAGAPLLPRTTPDEFRRWMAGMGFPWVTPHVLKHSAITLMLRGGANVVDVAAATNTDLRTITKVYRHHSQDEILTVLESRRA
jgi:integrase